MYKFKFIHIHPDDVKEESELRAGTGCFIYSPDGNQILSDGWAYLHPGDNFNRAIGRKLAAKRAIESIVVPIGLPGALYPRKVLRRALWELLFDISPSTKRAGRV